METERETRGAFHSTQISENISVDTSNGTDHFGLVRPVIHFERSGHFGLLGFPLSPVPLFCMLLKRTTTKPWLGQGQCNRNVPFHWASGIFRNFRPELFLLNEKLSLKRARVVWRNLTVFDGRHGNRFHRSKHNL